VAEPGPDHLVIADGAELTRQAADWIAGRIGRAVGARGRCSLALAGGSTPRPIYERLAARPAGDIAWERVDIFFGDERAVPADHADANFRMASDALLTRVQAPKDNVHRMEAERADRERAADDYARQLPDALDVLILGMGPDGHTASLFPGSAALNEAKRRVVPVVGPKPPPYRLTITPPVIRAARDVVVVAAGKDKAAAVARALEGPAAIMEIPIQLARRGTWFLDTAAASGLTRGGGAR
jgi:6-phosphogluconolactonase